MCAYNPYRWWTGKKVNKPLSVSAPLLSRIQNGDFDFSPYFIEAAEERMKAQKMDEDAARMKRVKAMKLDEVGNADEYKRLNLLRKALTEEFEVDLWDKAMEKQRGKGTIEDLYWWYKKECGLLLTKSELTIIKINNRRHR